MAECFHCGVSDKDEKLLEVVYKTGVNHLCERCYSRFRLPIVERKRIDWNKVDGERLSVREKLSVLAKVSPFLGRNRVESIKSEQDEKLRDLVEENFKRGQVVAKEISTELVDNFNWIIMRKRRSMKISHEQLAKRIQEPEVIVSSLEKGVLPRDYAGLIRKIESVLGIRLFREMKKDFNSNDIIAESKVPTGILLSEVKEKSTNIKNWFKKKNVDVSQQEIDKILKENDDEQINVENLDLDAVEEIVGTPIEEKNVSQEFFDEKVSNIEEEKKKQPEMVAKQKSGDSEKEDLSKEDISDLIWRN